MTGDSEIRRQMLDAADEFPVRGWTADVQRRVLRRRRITTGIAVAVSVVAIAGIAAGVVSVTGRGHVNDVSGPPPSATSTDYVGSGWRLTGVSHGGTSATISTNVGARMDLLPDGRLLAYNGVNAISATFTKSADGFEVRDPVLSAVGYVGNDPQVTQAVGALYALVYGDPGAPSRSACSDCGPGQGPVKDTVLTVDADQLVVQAGTFRLSFERIGPAVADRSSVPAPSGSPGRPEPSGKQS